MKRPQLRLGVDYEVIEIPQEFYDLGRRRTAHMLRYQIERTKLPDILANAYLQGIEDGYYTATRRKDEPPASS